MAVPSSGQILMSGIWNEIENNDYDDGGHGANENIKLSELSDGTQGTINRGNLPVDRPNGIAPHEMTEFYAYDHSATEPSFFDTLADFTISTTAGVGVAAVYSTTVQVRLSNAIGNFYGAITDSPANGTLSIAIGSSDPGTSGTGGSAGGWTTHGNITGGLAVSGAARTFIKFKWEATAFTINQALNVRFSINPNSATAQGLNTGIVDNATVTVRAT